jgi:hypothetical protein
MAIADTFSVDISGNIRRTGNAHLGVAPEYYTVLQLHRWLQDLADNQTESGNDFVSIVRTNPSDRSTDNIVELIAPYNIDDDASEYLYDGSIIQHSGNTFYDGIVNFGNTTYIQIVQNGALIANDFWNSNGGLNSSVALGISHRFLIKTRTGGTDIDSRRLLGLSREYGNTYSEFSINGTSRGNNVLALSQSTDLNNDTSVATVSGYSNITNISGGYNTIDLNNGDGPQPYYSKWNTSSRPINDFYEYAKYLTRRGTASTLYGINAAIFRGITNQVSISGGTGTFVEPESISWPTGSGQLLAVNNTTASLATKFWMQILTGSGPEVAHTVTANGGATAIVTANTSKNITPVFIGQSTGSAIIGSFGLGIEANDLSFTDTLTDLDGDSQTPPNNQTFTVSGLVSGEDTVLVAQNNGSDEILLNQLSSSTTYTGGEATFTVTTTIPSDTPVTGSFRVFNGSSYIKVTYTGYSGSSFTGCSGLPAVASNANVFISYIDAVASGTSLSYTAVYSTNRSLIVKVRDGGVSPIKPFKSPATFGAGGGSITAIRTSDA